MLSQNTVSASLGLCLPVVAALIVLLNGCSLFGSAEQTEGSFEATITGAIESEIQGSASYMQMNCASIELQSEQATLTFDDFCSTTSQGPKEGEYSIRQHVLETSDSTGYTAVYQPDESSSDLTAYRGIAGELVVTEVSTGITRGHFTLDANPNTAESRLNEGGNLIHIEGEFRAVAQEAKD